MADIAVVAHSRKSLGGGLPELRRILAAEGVADPLWYEVEKSRDAPKYARRAMARGADVMFVWGGDGTVQRCIDAVAGTGVAVAILPAGTANLLAANLGVPHDLGGAVQVGLHGDRRRLDTGSVNGERFTVMAGAGFDARVISDADRGAKDRLGRGAYVVTGIRNLGARRVRATVEVDGKHFFKGTVADKLAADFSSLDPRRTPPISRATPRRSSRRSIPWLETIAKFKATYPNTPVATTEPVADYMLEAAGTKNMTPFTLQADIMNGVDPSPQDVTTQENLFSQRKVKVFVYNQQVTDSLTQSFIADAHNADIPVIGVYETMPVPGYNYQSWMLAEVTALEKAVADHVSTTRL